jgi:hypothetical protein
MAWGVPLPGEQTQSERALNQWPRPAPDAPFPL